MASIDQSLYNIRLLEELAGKDTPIHRLHPSAKLLTTIVYLFTVVSFGKYDVDRLLPLVFYPVVVMAIAELPGKQMLQRLLPVLPLVVGIGIFNPVFDESRIVLGGLLISKGWLSFLSLMVKTFLTALSALILIASTGISGIAAALRRLKSPKVLVTQLLLTYRYITVLLEEVGRVLRAYSLRDPFHRGVGVKAWGSLVGQLLLRTFDRGRRIYQSMCLRGFTGDYSAGSLKKPAVTDLVYVALWILFFFVVRFFNLSGLIGSAVTGVGR